MDTERLTRRLEREKKARAEAERLLEAKALELFERNQALEKLSADLEKQVKQRTDQLAIALDDALEANKAKTAFIANMSHELRTPLTAVIGFTRGLIQGGISQDEQHRFLHTILANGEHLLDLVNDVLDVSKIETTDISINKAPLVLPILLDEVRELAEKGAAAKKLKFQYDEKKLLPSSITSDRVRLKQMLINVLNNAIKFTERGSIKLTVSYSQDANHLLFAVKDTGIGIPADKLDSVFERFVQLEDSSTRRYGGCGIGLYLTRQMSTLLGGRIEVKSKPEFGSVFTLTVDAGEVLYGGSLDELKGKESRQRQRIEAPPSLTGKILLVEDTRTNQEVFNLIVGGTGVDVSIANNGEEGVSAALEDEYDIVFMDIQMPVMDGKEALSNLRMLGYTGPIYALTANVMSADIAEYKSLGFDGTLQKPMLYEEIYQALKTHLKAKPEGESSTRSHQADEAMNKLRQSFVEDLVGYSAKLERAIAQRDFDGVFQQVHIIKGLSGSFGFTELFEGSKQLQDLLNKQHTDEALELGKGILRNIQRVLTSESGTA